MHVEPVHQRRRAPAPAIPLAEEVQPVDRVRRPWARSVGRHRIAARGQAETPDEDAGIDGLQRVVRSGEERAAFGCGDVLPVRVLGVREERRAGLVHHHVFLDVRVRLGERCHPRCELRRVRRIGEGRGVPRIDVERHLHARGLSSSQRRRNEVGLAALEAAGRRLVPAKRDRVGRHADSEQGRPERADSLLVLAGVVVDAPRDVVGGRGRSAQTEDGHAGRQCRKKLFHNALSPQDQVSSTVLD